MTQKVACNLCDQDFDKNDDLIEQRKKRHEEKHTRGWSFKAQRNGGGNNTTGKVIWRVLNE